MKKINLIEWLWKTDSHEKQSPQRFARYAAILIMLLTLGVGQMWADYYYRGGKNSWGATAMTVHNSGLYEYYSTSAQSFDGDQFKISKTTSGYDYNQSYVAKGFNGGSNDIGDYGGDNCYIWSSSNGYIIVYYPNTVINTTSNPKITFRTSLYAAPTFYIKHTFANGSTWSWGTMSRTGEGIYTYTGNCYTSNGANVYTSQTNNNYLSPSGTSGVNNGVPAVWTYNAKSNSLSVAPAYTLTVTNDGHGSSSGSVSKGIKMSTKYAISASSPSTGYHFNNWTRVSGGTCTFDNASSASTNVTVTGDASATVQANFALNTYTVAYNANDDQYPGTATGSTSSSSHTYSTAKKLTSNGFSRTGYSFAGWATTPTGSVAYSDGQSVTNLSSTHGATVTLYAKWTENMSDVSLVASPTGKGSFTIGGAAATSTTAGVTTTRSVTAVPIAGYSFTGWSITGGATISSTSDNPTTVTGGGAGTAATLTATFEENLVYYDVTFGVGTGYTSLGSISATNNTTSSSISSGDDLLSASSVTFTASPNTGYEVAGFYSDASCTSSLQSGNTTTYTIASLSDNVTVYVKFQPITYTLTWSPSSAPTGCTYTTKPTTGTYGNTVTMVITPSTGYTVSVSAVDASSNTVTLTKSTNTYTFTQPASAVTVTVSTSQIMSTLSTSISYDGANPSYANPTKSVSSIGIATTATVTATAAGTGYTFAGWTLTNCTRTDGGAATATSITIRSNGDGAAATVVANYNEVLTTSWYIAGDGNGTGTDLTPGSPFAGWGTSGTRMSKKSGHSTEEIYYCTITVSTVATTDDHFPFKVYNSTGSQYYGNDGYWVTKENNHPTLSSTSGSNMKFRPYITGTYEFKVDNTGANPVLTVTWPVFNQVRISAASPSDAGNVGNYDLSDPVSNVRTVTRSLKANTTYTFKIMYNSDWYGYNSGTFTRSTSTSSNSRTLTTSGGNLTLTTDYAGDYTFKFNQSTKALSIDFPAAYKVTYGKGSVNGSTGSCSAVDIDNSNAAVTSNSTWVKNGHQVKLTAPDEKTGYAWDGWFDNNSGSGDAITTNKVCTLTVNSDKTAYACYHQIPRTVTVNAGSHGSVASASVTAYYESKTTLPTATPDPGYYFTGWTTTSGSLSYDNQGSADAAKVYGMTANATVQANFAPIWRITCSSDSHNTENHQITNITTAAGVMTSGYVDITLDANTDYDFKVFNKSNNHWWGKTSTVTKITYANQATAVTLSDNTGNNQTFLTAGAGTYRFTWNTSNNQVTVTYPTSYTVTYYNKFRDIDGTITTATTGGSISGMSGSASGAQTSGKYFNNTETVTLTHTTANSGYNWIGWYNSEACSSAYSNGGNVAISDASRTIGLSNLSANAVVAALFEEIGTDITLANDGHGHVEINSATETSTTVGKTTSRTIVAVPTTGYHFNAWTATSGTDYTIGNTGSASTSLTGKGSGASSQTVTATFTANSYSVRFNANGGSGSMSNQAFTYDAAQDLTACSFSKTGYTFGGWAISPENAAAGTKAYDDEESVINLNSTNGAIVDLYAIWTAKSYIVELDIDEDNHGTIDGKDTEASVTYDAAPTTIAAAKLPTAANGYCFMGFFTATAGGGVQVIDADGTWISDVTGYMSSGNWVYDGEPTLYAYYKKAEITAITFTDGAVVAPSTSKTVTATISPTPTGTTTVCWRVLYSNDNPMDPQPSFSSVSGNSVSFTAPATSGMYKMEAVLHLGSGCGGTELSTYVANFQVAGDHTVTVQYKDASNNVIAASGSVTGKPLEWTEVVAHEIFGYTYSGMTAGDGVTLRDTTAARLTELQAEDPTIVGVKRMKAVYDGKLTINYTQNQMIYFKNTLGWENVYVNFHTGNAWNNTDNGSGSPKGVGNSGLANANKHMTRIGDTDVWYYDYGYNNGGSSISPSLYISFTDQSRPSASEFWGTNPGINVVYPANYADALSTDKSSENGFKAATPMFVPLAGQDPVAANVSPGGKANYYNRGYWTTYTAGTGYTLEIYYDNDESECIQSIPFTSADDLMPMSAVVDLEASTTYRYQVRRGGTEDAGIYYGNTGTMTYASHGVGTGWDLTNTMAGGFKKAKITTNASGNYTFNLSYTPNASSEYRLRMELDYPIADGDYRLIYKDNVHTAFKPSAIVTKANNSKDTVSFFVRPGSTPVLKIQQASVTNAGVITWGDLSDISSSVSSLSKDSVYNICLTMNGSGVISVENVEAYTGNFYIRTNAAGASKWDNYRSSDHLMTYSEYSEKNADYSHYFMAYVGNGTNVKFVVANDYSPCISDTVIVQTYRDGDASHVNGEGDIQADANVRFMWNRHNNGAYRAYLAAAKSDGSKFLVLRANSNTDLMDENGNALINSANSGEAGYNHKAPDNSMQFIDDENWIYETTVKIKPGAFLKLYANFHGADFYYKGENNDDFDGSNAIQLLGGKGDAEKIRVIYDFKTDRLVSAWMPTGDINEVKEIYADVMFVREHQGDIEQLTFSKGAGETMGAITKIETAYGVLRFNKWTINNKSKADGHAVLDPGASRYERDLFYVSFPFRVAMNEVFGFGTYGKHWIIEYYDGAARAANGFWADTPTFWRYVTDRKGKFFEPNQGYIIALDLDEMGESSEVWDNGVENVELYFPSYGTMGDITNSEVNYSLPSHAYDPAAHPTHSDDRSIADSHWNVMSVPTYVNTSNVSFTNTDWTATRPSFLYEWNMGDNSLTPRSGSDYTYHAMHAYMVQYNGNVTWTSTSVTPASVAARRAYAEAPQNVEFRLELRQNEQIADQTFVRLSNDEEVSADFAFGEDMSKEFNKTRSNIYTFIGTEQVAGNVLPLTEQTTVVPVGLVAKTNGDYTFSIPEGTNGVGVTLIDNETGIRTSLSALDYTVDLEAGTYNDRFVLEISPIHQMPTSIEEVTGDGLQVTGARKLMIDGILYIVKDGKMFDAQGKRLQ